MSQQLHIRLDDNLYKSLSELSSENARTLQDSITTSIRQMLNQAQTKPGKKADFTFIDLFAGIGGMRLAFEKAGGECVYSNEWNKYSQQTYYANFGDQPEGDITKVNASDIPDHDILVAGFPCQPFSIAGVSKKNSLGRATGFEDKTQGTLFFDVCRVLKEKRPKAFMLENVKNLCSHDKGHTFKVIQESLNELGYKIFYKVIDGQNYVPQHRERIIIVGFDRNRFPDDFEFKFDLTPIKPKPVIADILDSEVDPKYTLTDKLWTYLQNYAAKHKAAGNGFGYGFAPMDGVSRTLSARYYKDGSEILIPQEGKNPRRLTPRECARLQGFPESFVIPVSDTQAYRQFGNSVVVPLMTDVASLIAKAIKENEITGSDDSQSGSSSLDVNPYNYPYGGFDMKNVDNAIQDALQSEATFCKFLAANDTGETGGHQSGIYIPKTSIKLIFDEPGERGTNKERWASITWPEGNITRNRFIYYGKGTRNEYRITNFGRGFKYMNPEYTGALLVINKLNEEKYSGFVFNTDLEIERFLDAFGLSPVDTNRLIETGAVNEAIVANAMEQMEIHEIEEFIAKLQVEFPLSEEMSAAARQIQNKVWDHEEYIRSNPDKKLVDWTNTEYRLFQAIENARYGDQIRMGFQTIEEFISIANSVLNRRKSRAGKSLEHHLAALFTGNDIVFTPQGRTEGNKKPDFIFPSQEAYHNPEFPVEKLAVLGAKTTCKDRWRQILNEANRLREMPKFLCTLQQGVSSAQMDEMQEENVILVVPEEYISTYPKDKQDRIWTVKKFIEYILELESING